MIDSSAPNNAYVAPPEPGTSSGNKVATCFVSWPFMEFRDLFGDGSPDGDFQRLGCLHEASADGTCPNAHADQLSGCSHSVPTRRVVPIDPESNKLPREQIRRILEDGDEICLEFPLGGSPTDGVLTETAHLLRKLRNTGIPLTVSGLSTADKSRLSRLEWQSN